MMKIILSYYESRLRKRGQKLLIKARYKQAFRCFSKALKINESPENQFHLGLTLLSLQRYVEAETLFRIVKKRMPENEINIISLGESLMMQRKWDDAANCYAELVKGSPRGTAFQSILNIAEDVALREKYVRSRELIAQAQTAVKDNHLDEAITLLHQAREYQPQNPTILHNIASILRLQKKFPEALPFIQQAIKLDPQNMKFQNNLLLIQRKIKKNGS